ncbi:RICIN domain-containing protein [Bacillus cereus]
MSVGSSLNDATEQQWIIYPVDGNRYILANRLTGTVATVSPEHLNPDNMLTEFYTGYNGQYWLAQKSKILIIN